MIIQPINTATTAKGTPAMAHAFVRVSASAAVRAAIAGRWMSKRMPAAYRSMSTMGTVSKQPSRLHCSLGNAGFMFAGNAGNGVNAGIYRYDSGGSA